MQTSYYARAGKLPAAVGISRTVPRGWKGRRMMELAPPVWLLHAYKAGEVTFAQYEVAYAREVLALLDPQQVAQQLGSDAVLLCWERDATLCHRRIVARWLEYHLDIVVPEL